MAAIGLGLPVLCVWLALRGRLPASAAMRAGLAIAGGLGAAGSVATVLLVLIGRTDRMFVAVDALLWCSLTGAAFLSTRRRSVPVAPMERPRRRRWASAVFAVLACVNVAMLITGYIRAPHGAWDAWAIWNLRARFLFRVEDWHEAVSAALVATHPDYPLLLPLNIARLWAWHGGEAAWVPALAAFLFGVATVLVVMGAARDSAADGSVGGLALLAAGPWIWEVLSQCADIPLGLFFAATLALMTNGIRRADASLVACAGVASSFAAWTKNEGLLFVVIVAVVVLLVGADRMPRWRALAAWLAGALPVLLVVAWYKLSIAPANDLAQPLADAWAKLMDPSRHFLVVKTAIAAAAPWWIAAAGAWLIAALVLRRRWDATAIRIAAVVLLMLAGYFVVYVVTTQSLEWHVNTSLSRLSVQLWPSAVLALLVAYSGAAATPMVPPSTGVR
jgi:hypothetical protein